MASLPLNQESGAILLPMVFFLIVLTFAQFGIWGNLRRWRFLVENQLRIDRCVGETALKLKSIVVEIEASNRRIKALRFSLASTGILPSAQTLLKTALIVETTKQEAILLGWKVNQVRWISRRGCDSKSRDVSVPLPPLPWVRDPPDIIGPAPLRWVGVHPRSFHIQLGHPPRHAAATVKEEKNEDWTARWIPPNTPLLPRTSFH